MTRFLIRFSGDLGTKKGRAFIQFRARLARNLRDGLRQKGIRFKLKTTRGRLYLDAEDPGAAEVLEHVFGVQSFSRIHCRSFSGLDDIVEEGEKIFGSSVTGRTFAVRARRSMVRDLVDFTSEDIERRLGSRLLDRSAGVDLSNPQPVKRQGVQKK